MGRGRPPDLRGPVLQGALVSRAGVSGHSKHHGGIQACRGQGPAGRDRRSQLGGRRARLGPGDLHAGGRGGSACPAGRAAQPFGAREGHRRGARSTARRTPALRRRPAARFGRCLPDPRRAPRLREGRQGAGRVRRPLERAQLRLLRRLDPGAPRQRLRRHAPAAGEVAGFQPPVRRLLRSVRSHRRPADRRPRRGHDDRQGAGAVRRAARAAGADRACHRRAAAHRR